MPPVILTFDTTHHALWAEQLALGAGFGAQVIPAPADSDAKCDLALEVLSEEAEPLQARLHAEGILFRVYSAGRRGA
jgi:hypothetical protein